MKNKTILITGASGFLGTWLADEVFEAGYELIGIDLRAPSRPEIWSNFVTASTDNVDWENLLHGKDIYGVCHLAGGASVALSVNDPYSDFSNLLPGTARLALYLSKMHSQAKFILFSSAAVYGNASALPIVEETIAVPISPYGIHKYIAELLLENYSRIYGLSVTVLRIFSVYGPGLRKQLIWDVGNRAIAADKQGKEAITLFGTGDETRDFIYVKDLCESVVNLLNNQTDNKFQLCNMASGIESSVSEIANGLIKHLDLNVKINFDGNIPKGDPLNVRADINRLKSTGAKINYSLDMGLEQVAKWIKTING
ncbi:NAD-dependent epimerase/dehydratase family protein [Mucilaginibacter sp. RCC_168]|uniref:NAD-dependent epimerase/dehydratase family protein n=1 Tax=Mucilaginibacter sp. RCC_168 TaxID=3239221 RepID=UPI003524D3C8